MFESGLNRGISFQNKVPVRCISTPHYTGQYSPKARVNHVSSQSEYISPDDLAALEEFQQNVYDSRTEGLKKIVEKQENIVQKSIRCFDSISEKIDESRTFLKNFTECSQNMQSSDYFQADMKVQERFSSIGLENLYSPNSVLFLPSKQ